MSLALQALLVVGGGCAFALLLHVLVRRTVPLKVLEEHRPVAGVLLSVVGGVNGILLAFVMVTVWQNVEDVREGITAEANAVANIARLAEGMPAPTGPELHDTAVAYLDAVVRDEWPRLANGAGTSCRAWSGWCSAWEQSRPSASSTSSGCATRAPSCS